MGNILVPIIIVIAVIIIGIVIWYISTGNKFARYIVKIEEAESNIGVALEKRFDLLTKLFDVAKGYADFEKETMVETIRMRSGGSIKESMEADKQIAEGFKAINVVAENYPQLRANETFIELQKAARDTEDHLQAARRLYNANISAFNQSIVVFPSSIVANNKGYTKRPMYEVEETKRQDVSLKF